ncbi:MAG: hypothetical protein WC809_04830 [Sinimarinibacterium sp.]|jgi:hypothetical protein
MKHTWLAAVFAVSLAACGGGGGDGDGGDNPEPATSAEGLWVGTTSTNRSFAALVLDDGTYWVLYSSQGNSAVVGGAIQGSGTSQSGSFTSSNGRDFSLEGLGVTNLTLNANYVMKQSFNGTVRYTASGEQVTFTSSYDSGYDLTPSLAAVAGSYSGSAATSGGTEAANVSISAAGAISGSGASGCTYSGSATPRARGNVYDISVTFNGGVCANGTSTVSGVAYYDASTKQITSTALNDARTDGFIYIGTKP